MNKFALAAIAGILTTTAASAADLIIPTSAPANVYETDSAFNWSGFYAGVNAGYGWAEIDALGLGFDDIDGLLGGAQIGYNHDFGGIVLGAEADFQLSDVNYELAVAGDSLEFGIDNFGTVRARAGVAVDRFLPYVTGGLAWANASAEATVGGVSDEIDDTYFGWTVGVGAEYAVTDNVTVKAEYLYADFGDADFDSGVDVGLTANIVRAGVNFKF